MSFFRVIWPGLAIVAILALATLFTWPDRASCLYHDAAGALQLRC